MVPCAPYLWRDRCQASHPCLLTEFLISERLSQKKKIVDSTHGCPLPAHTDKHTHTHTIQPAVEVWMLCFYSENFTEVL